MPAKILVIEDDRDIRRNMQKLLEGEGYEVVVAENGKVALDLLHSAALSPDVILLDLMMPVLNGFQFCEAQEQSPRIAAIPVVLLTADGHIDEKEIRFRVRTTLKKPASVDAILSAVEEILISVR